MKTDGCTWVDGAIHRCECTHNTSFMLAADDETIDTGTTGVIPISGSLTSPAPKKLEPAAIYREGINGYLIKIGTILTLVILSFACSFWLIVYE